MTFSGDTDSVLVIHNHIRHDVDRLYNSLGVFCIVLFRMNYDRFENLSPLPFDIRLTKGSVHIIASRAFVDFVIHNDTAIQFRDWIKESFYPDETFFSSLNHSPNLGIPGAYLGLCVFCFFLFLALFMLYFTKVYRYYQHRCQQQP